jgi:ABC-type protease/lipase transport system fused ATPase/permease subunit
MEEESEEWNEKKNPEKSFEEKKQDKKKLLKYSFVFIAAIALIALFSMGFFGIFLSFIINYRYNILIGLIILAAVILLLERKEK